MSTCYIFTENGVKMTQRQVVKEIRRKLMADPGEYPGLSKALFSKDVTTQSEVEDVLQEIKPIAKKLGGSHQGVSSYIESRHQLTDDPTSPAVLLVPVINTENYIEEFVKAEKDAGRSEEIAREDILQQIADWSLENKMGELQHALVHELFEHDGDISHQAYKDALKQIKNHLNDTTDQDGKSLDENKRTLRAIVTEDNPELTDDQIVNTLSQNAQKIYKSITSKPEYEGAKFFSEWYIYADDVKNLNDSYKGIRGIADLIVVKADGSVDIIDFKVSNREFTGWCAAKLYHTEYQLGLYRQMLAKHGIKASNMNLFVLPIYLNRHNAEDSFVGKSRNDSNPMINLCKRMTSAKRFPRLDWINGEFTEKIRFLVGSGEEAGTIQESVALDDSAMELFHQMVDYTPTEKQYSRDEIIETKLKEFVDSKGNKRYTFYNTYKQEKVVNSDKEFFTKPGGYIDQYIQTMRSLKNAWVIDLLEAIEEYKQNGTLPKDFNFLNRKASPGSVNMIMNTIFGEFVKPEYELINQPALINNGIIGFKNKNSKICHFIVLTDQSLNAPIANGKYGSILGNFYTNDEVRQLNGVTTLHANVLSAESIKCVHLLNMIAEQNPEFFKEKSIGSIRVINPAYSGENNSYAIDDILSNYDILCHETNTSNHFNKEIQLASPWEALGFELKQIEEQYTDDPELSRMVKSFKANTYSRNGKVKQLIQLRKKLEQKYPKFQFKEFDETTRYDTSDPITMLYLHVCELLMYYQGLPIDPTGNFDKWGFRGSSILDLFGMTINSNQSFLDKKGNVIRGIGSGTHITSAENSPSPTLRALAEYYEQAYAHIREEFQEAHKNIQDITLPYISRFQSKANRVLSGINTDMWEKLLVKDSKNQISDTLTLRNPYTDTSLDKETAQFLKSILWEINKYRFKDKLGDHTDWTYKENASEIDEFLMSNDAAVKIFQSRYFELPLKRARYFERWKKVKRIGLKDLLLKEYETLKDDWDLTKTHGTQRSMISKELRKNATTMYNQYNIDPQDREFLIREEGASDFELDLDLLALDVAFQSIRQDYFENVLQVTAACATMLHFTQQLTGTNRSAELEALAARDKTSIKNESYMSEEAETPGKVVNALRKLNSLLVLAFRPLQLIKEITFGQFTNYSRVLGQIGSSDKLSIKSVFEANTTIWGQSIGKWAKAFTSDADIASYTLCESLNKIYSIANEDISRTVENSMLSRHGMLANLSKYMYLANSAPDYFNRLTLFVAKMMEDGCFEAHSLDKDGMLKYDFKKDKRFSELNKHGLNSNYRGEKYLEQKALYLAMAEQFEKEGRSFIEYDKDGNVTYKEFDRAYTTKQRNSIKEVADLAYGYYDHEIKSLVDLGFFGLIWKQFQTFVTAKANLWFRGRPTTKGDNTAQGRFVPLERNGEKYYRRIIERQDGSPEVKFVPESQLTEEEKGQLDLAYVWQGDYIEGLMYSIMGTLHDLFHADFKSIKENKYRLANLSLALHDILIGIILFSIFKWLWSGGTKKMQDVKPLQRVVLRAMQDTSPTAIASMSWTPGFWSSLVNLRDDAIEIFSDGDPDIQKMFIRRIGAIKDWNWNEHD